MEAEASELLAPLNVRLGDTLGSAWPRKSMHPLPRRSLPPDTEGRRGQRGEGVGDVRLLHYVFLSPLTLALFHLALLLSLQIPSTLISIFLLFLIESYSLELIPRARAKGKLYHFARRVRNRRRVVKFVKRTIVGRFHWLSRSEKSISRPLLGSRYAPLSKQLTSSLTGPATLHRGRSSSTTV